MLTHPTLGLLHELGLSGMASGFKALDANPEARALGHAEWLGLLLDHEATARRQKRFEARARAARLRHPASIEDVDYRSHRGLDRALFLKLATGDWIRTRRNLVITGPCGVGKSWLACALGHKACRDDLSVLYYRVSRLFAALSLARGDGRYGRLLRQIARVNLLILDDWGPEPLLPEQACDLLEIVEDRYDAGSTLITARCRWITGTRSSASPRSPMPSSTGCCTMPTALSSPAKACANARRPSRLLDLLNRPRDLHPRPAGVPRRWAASDRTSGRLRLGMTAGPKSESPAGFVGIRSLPQARRRFTREGQVWRPRRLGRPASQGAGGRERPVEADVGRRDARQRSAEGSSEKEVVTPAARREAVAYLAATFGMSERRACRVVGIERS
ncbi:hypothetical protein MMMDOFMJ_2928 [Methylobacterium gnaphalii]|nr:hypothetical protein MMMDOFMJ_2928 [Methylobacterium gnaphalii]